MNNTKVVANLQQQRDFSGKKARAFRPVVNKKNLDKNNLYYSNNNILSNRKENSSAINKGRALKVGLSPNVANNRGDI